MNTIHVGGGIALFLLLLGFIVNQAMAWKLKLLVAANILLWVGIVVAQSPNGNISQTSKVLTTYCAIAILMLVTKIVCDYFGLDRRAP